MDMYTSRTRSARVLSNPSYESHLEYVGHGRLVFTANVPHIICPAETFHSFIISCRYSMELPENISTSESCTYSGPLDRRDLRFLAADPHTKRSLTRVPPFLLPR